MWRRGRRKSSYSSRTRASTDRFKALQRCASTLSQLLREAAGGLAQDAKSSSSPEFAERKVYNIVHLIYRSKHYEGNSKDYEFSRLSMDDHWRAGYHDAVRTLRHPEMLERPNSADGVFDLRFAEHGVTGRPAIVATTRRQGGAAMKEDEVASVPLRCR